MSEALLEARGLEKSYQIADRSLPILRGVDLKFKSEELVALLGSSGAGKSTLLHLLGLLDFPTKGEVLFKNEPTANLSSEQKSKIRNRSIGFVFQFYHLIPELTALQNTLLPKMIGSSVLGWSKISQQETNRAEELLTRFGLKERLSHKPSELSGGERQRVAIARALLPKPEIILCDEPTGNLDSKTGNEILDILQEVHEREKTSFVIVTHDEKVAKRCDRIIRMADGKIVPERS